jgi:hypothetical protein
MASFGGLGGNWGTSPMSDYADDLFVLAVERCLGEQIRTVPGMGADMWSAVANQDWKHANGDDASYSFRAAGDFIAAICGKGMYMDWYCSGPYPQVSAVIREAMKKEGWEPTADGGSEHG